MMNDRFLITHMACRSHLRPRSSASQCFFKPNEYPLATGPERVRTTNGRLCCHEWTKAGQTGAAPLHARRLPLRVDHSDGGALHNMWRTVRPIHMDSDRRIVIAIAHERLAREVADEQGRRHTQPMATDVQGSTGSGCASTATGRMWR